MLESRSTPADFSYRLELELLLNIQHSGQGTEGSEWICLRDTCMTVGSGGGEVNTSFSISGGKPKIISPREVNG